jgi:tRNA dimethylallyltransferase
LVDLVAHEKPGIIVLGPTASGKTHLAIAVASRFNGEIVSCDALQIYRHMDIGTAKAHPRERADIPHHLIDVQDPEDEFSAGEYQRQAREAILAVTSRGHLPVVAGGTGFYLRALLEGLFQGPERSDELRDRMRTIILRRGIRTLYRALQRCDPVSADRIAEADSERIIRAYEVYLVSGRTMSWWQQQPKDTFRGYRWLKIGIDFPREKLYRRIDQRVESMFQQGFIEEVHGLLQRYPRTCHAFKAIGYRQSVKYLEGKATLTEAVEATQQESRRYAKRQLTWFKADPEVVWLDGEMDPRDLVLKAEDMVRTFLFSHQGDSERC